MKTGPISTATDRGRGPFARTAVLLWLGRCLFHAGMVTSAFVVGIVLLGVAQRVGWIQADQPSPTTAGQQQDATYTCPMHPHIRQDGPGDCPICGMDLVPASGQSKVTPGGSGGGSKGRFVCPMMCTPPSGKPGRCPVCAMELAEVTDRGGDTSTTIEPAARRLAGIRTARAELGPVQQTIGAIGLIDYDESRLATLSAG
ncbi:MAG: hypothetical protein MI861_11760, partial [Pirellulales bacterium]|nr:hypothetical protein [Pirellulales bacterium]